MQVDLDTAQGVPLLCGQQTTLCLIALVTLCEGVGEEEVAQQFGLFCSSCS